MKRFLIILMVGALLLSVFACGTSSSDPVDADMPTEAPSIDGAREITFNKLSSYYSENKEKLAVLAGAFLQSEYQSVDFYADTANVLGKGISKYISKDDLDEGLKAYYSLTDPFFADIVRCDAGKWVASVDTVHFDYKIIQTCYPDITIEGVLCYGKGFSKNFDASYSYYIDVLDDDWAVFYNYIENDVRW